MGRNALRPHVAQVHSILSGLATREKVEAALDRFVNEYLVPLEGAKRAVVVRFGGSPGALFTRRPGWNYQSILCQYGA